jgi:hypothetical protein
MGITELSNILVFAPMNQRALPWLVPAFNAWSLGIPNLGPKVTRREMCSWVSCPHCCTPCTMAIFPFIIFTPEAVLPLSILVPGHMKLSFELKPTPRSLAHKGGFNPFLSANLVYSTRSVSSLFTSWKFSGISKTAKGSLTQAGSRHCKWKETEITLVHAQIQKAR